MSSAQAHLEVHFDDMGQQRHASDLGIWVFLATEVLFFGGLFLSYTVYRVLYADAFARAARELSVGYGVSNLLVLLASSCVLKGAVDCAGKGKRGWVIGLLACTILLGLGFLAIEVNDWRSTISDGHWPGSRFLWDGPHPGQAQLFYWLFFVMTGLHFCHVVIGVCVLTTMLVMAALRSFSPGYYTPLEVASMYWGFVDIVWVFLFHIFYLGWSSWWLVLAFAIAGFMVLFIMGVYHHPQIIKAVILAALFWFGIMITMTLQDYLTRHWLTFPLSVTSREVSGGGRGAGSGARSAAAGRTRTRPAASATA